ncbi:response regulator [Azospirillum sp. ST 5-10]|uniref:response regulator n=1 Tax=unclassified Azospirillum TaxID=2630922 RepID=UPI003F4A2488
MTRSILIVEDEAIVALANAEMIVAMGYDVVGPAESCAEALAMAERARPALALVDIRIRGAVDGIDTARALRERFGCAIVFVTGQNDPHTRQRALALGDVHYLRKPFTVDQLADAIHGALPVGA